MPLHPLQSKTYQQPEQQTGHESHTDARNTVGNVGAANNDPGSDHFHKSIASATFSASLTREDYEYYIAMTFNNVPEHIRVKMKDLYDTKNEKPSSEDLILENHSDGSLSAILIQILTETDEHNELKMVVGIVSMTQRPGRNLYGIAVDWENQKDKVQRALQYIFGNEARKELTHM
ncbi:hypothetical protein I4U23_010355 [Adineta vaga]|nr:hypothetical protein I4U23_010355 [Adineta vaga]